MFHQRPSMDALESRRLLAAVSFLIDSDQSSLTISASARVSEAGSVKLKAQEEGLDTAALSGSIRIDVSSKGVRFNGGNAIEAVDHAGSYAPENEPADFAVEGKLKKLGIKLATAKASVRDLALDVTSSARKSLRSDGRFALRDAEMEATAGRIDYVVDSRFGDADGSKSIAGQETDLKDAWAKLTGAAGSRTLTLPIEVQYKRKLDNGSSATFTLRGQIVAQEVSFAGTHLAPAATVAKPTGKRLADEVL